MMMQKVILVINIYLAFLVIQVPNQALINYLKPFNVRLGERKRMPFDSADLKAYQDMKEFECAPFHDTTDHNYLIPFDFELFKASYDEIDRSTKFWDKTTLKSVNGTKDKENTREVFASDIYVFHADYAFLAIGANGYDIRVLKKVESNQFVNYCLFTAVFYD